MRITNKKTLKNLCDTLITLIEKAKENSSSPEKDVKDFNLGLGINDGLNDNLIIKNFNDWNNN